MRGFGLVQFADHCLVMSGDRILFDPTCRVVIAPGLRVKVYQRLDISAGISFAPTEELIQNARNKWSSGSSYRPGRTASRTCRPDPGGGSDEGEGDGSYGRDPRGRNVRHCGQVPAPGDPNASTMARLRAVPAPAPRIIDAALSARRFRSARAWLQLTELDLADDRLVELLRVGSWPALEAELDAEGLGDRARAHLRVREDARGAVAVADRHRRAVLSTLTHNRKRQRWAT